jgi:hypothetical protein
MTSAEKPSLYEPKQIYGAGDDSKKWSWVLWTANQQWGTSEYSLCSAETAHINLIFPSPVS